MVFIDPSLTRSPKLISISSRCTNTFLSAQIHYFGAKIYFSMHKHTSLRDLFVYY